MGRALVFFSLLVACTESPSPTGTPPLETPPQWVDITAQPCALNSEGQLRCWTSEEWEIQIPETFGDLTLRDIFSDQGHSGIVMGIDTQDHIQVLMCEFVRGCPVVGLPIKQANGTLALGTDNHLYLQSPLFASIEGYVHENMDMFDQWLLVPRISPSIIAINARHEVWTGRQFEEPDIFTLDIPGRPLALVGTSSPSGGCVLDDAGMITCFGDEFWTNMPFNDPPYQFLDGAAGAVCAVQAETHQITCYDGTTYNWGPLVAFAASPYPYIGEDGRRYTGRVAEPSVCAITHTNELRCAGPRYPEDLLLQLDQTNAEHRSWFEHQLPGR